ncbi:MAG: AGE family epimerase/isomerase [Candidatus Marinimicrobia bacterium]|nr:AGE family epimerase/isomerase [Candidatus Neomarinimicrobiota bacterium]
MLRIVCTSLTLLILNFGLKAQYVPVSPYLNDPALTIGYVDSCAQFWMNTLDETRGGYYTNIDREGDVITSWGTNKNLLTQTRNAYGFTRAYMMTGHDQYREYARAGLDFMYEHAWDAVNGGWYSQMDIDGNVQGATNGRSAFDEHYALLGPSAAFEAFGDSTDLNMLLQGYSHLEDIYWDDRDDFHGYYDWATYNGSATYNKSFNATVDAITTHLLSLYLQTGSQIYLDRMHEISEEIIEHLVGSMPSQAVGFVEEFDANWNWDNGETMTIMGHVLKSAWCLIRVYQIDPLPEYLEAAEALMADVLNNGYDHDLGGPYKDYNRTTGGMLMWGNPDTAKAWWQMEQAVTAGFQLYSVTADDRYIEVADETLHFFMQHFVDHTYGDVYENRTRYGDETWGLNKGGSGKAAYHSIETGYYAYLYGSLFLQETAFSLYYWFEAEPVDRMLTLTPLHSTEAPFRIESVQLDGEEYTNFSGVSRNLSIPADLSGEFRVTFMPGVQSATDMNTKPETAYLSPVFPNPFNPSTSLNFEVDKTSSVEIAVFDIQGRKIKSLVSADYPPGKYQAIWDGLDYSGKEVPTGVYLFKGVIGTETVSQKGLLIK